MGMRSTVNVHNRLLNLSSNFLRKMNLSSAASVPTLRFVQFLRKNDKRMRLGVVSEDGSTLSELSANTCISNDLVTFLKQGLSLPDIEARMKSCRREQVNDDYTLLPPITNPGKIVCVGLNYKDYCEAQEEPLPEAPVFFNKYTSAVIGPIDTIVLPPMTKKVDWEVELAVVIGKHAKSVSRKNAMDVVFGYTVAQDISARDWQQRHGGQVVIAKSMDTFCPLGPSVVHKKLIENVNNLTLTTKLNGVEKQFGNTKNMVFQIDEVISRLSQIMTLNIGDVILTGTPSGVGMQQKPPEYLKAGDVLQSEIQCLGKIRNKVIEANVADLKKPKHVFKELPSKRRKRRSSPRK